MQKVKKIDKKPEKKMLQFCSNAFFERDSHHKTEFLRREKNSIFWEKKIFTLKFLQPQKFEIYLEGRFAPKKTTTIIGSWTQQKSIIELSYFPTGEKTQTLVHKY